MKRHIKLKDKTIVYQLRRSRKTRYMRLTVNNQGEVIATLPFFTRISMLERFIKSKAGWIVKKIFEVRNQPKSLLDRGSRKLYLKNKEVARKLVFKKMNYFNNYYGFKFNRISIRNQRCRWGSCSSKKNLNFNWRIIYLPKEQADYLIVHELCHLKEMNHSQKFWGLVGRTIPDYKKIRKEMRAI